MASYHDASTAKTPQPVHNTKVSLEVLSYEVTRIALRSAFLELATGATGTTGSGEVVSKTAAQTPPPTHAGGQDDGSYTNSLKLMMCCWPENTHMGPHGPGNTHMGPTWARKYPHGPEDTHMGPT